MLVVLVVGALDDHKDLSIRFRIFFHIVAALIVVSTNGVILSSLGWIFGIVEFKLYSWSVFVSVFAIIGVMNAVNMSDGIDGLSGLLSIVTLSFISYFAYIGGREDLFTLALLSCSTLVPFLMFNLGIFGRSRKVFMGDAGTTFIGLLIAVLLIQLYGF
jgi:UDP-GlcNAc:undecaprenyl-phosphate GlcNAc-1-phosphate transferase